MEFLSAVAKAFEEGGVWMYAILFLQIVSLAIVLERSYALFIKRKMVSKQFALRFEENIKKGNLKAVVEQSRQGGELAIAKAIEAGAQSAYHLGGQNEIQGKMDEVLVEENSRLEARLGFLGMTGNVATLVGLLGTISGMIRSFAAVANASPIEKAALLAAGISEAMHATAYGLIVAIPALFMFAVLQNRANILAEDLNQAALKVFNWLSYSFEGVPAKRVVKPQERDLSRPVEA